LVGTLNGEIGGNREDIWVVILDDMGKYLLLQCQPSIGSVMIEVEIEVELESYSKGVFYNEV
jgi:hypothetical protein